MVLLSSTVPPRLDSRARLIGLQEAVQGTEQHLLRKAARRAIVRGSVRQRARFSGRWSFAACPSAPVTLAAVLIVLGSTAFVSTARADDVRPDSCVSRIAEAEPPIEQTRIDPCPNDPAPPPSDQPPPPGDQP